MTEVEPIRKRMLALAVVTGAVLIAITILSALKYNSLDKSAWICYMMAVPIFMTVLAFVLGYIDINEKLDDDEVAYMVRRTYIFGGLMFVITLAAELAVYLR